MFILICPTCNGKRRLRFAKSGATATCIDCKSTFKVDPKTLLLEQDVAAALVREGQDAADADPGPIDELQDAAEQVNQTPHWARPRVPGHGKIRGGPWHGSSRGRQKLLLLGMCGFIASAMAIATWLLVADSASKSNQAAAPTPKSAESIIPDGAKAVGEVGEGAADVPVAVPHDERAAAQ